MKSGGLVLWSAIAIFEVSKTRWQKGKLLVKCDLQNHSKEQWLNVIRFQREIIQDFTNLARYVCQECFLGVH